MTDEFTTPKEPAERQEALKRRAASETLAEIAKSYAVDLSMISRLS